MGLTVSSHDQRPLSERSHDDLLNMLIAEDNASGRAGNMFHVAANLLKDDSMAHIDGAFLAGIEEIPNFLKDVLDADFDMFLSCGTKPEAFLTLSRRISALKV